jgi:hypothetical protein
VSCISPMTVSQVRLYHVGWHKHPFGSYSIRFYGTLYKECF